MVESSENKIDLTFLDTSEKKNYIVLIILNRPIIRELFNKLKNKIDFIICADGASNRMFDNLQDDEQMSLPDCIVGDFDSIRPEVQDYYVNNGVRLFKREDLETTDLEKCLYVSLEKISEMSNSDNCETEQKSKEFSIIILGASGGRIDHTISAYSQVYKYIQNYSYQFKMIEVLLMSKSSCSIYLKPGMNRVLTSSCWEKKSDGYSIIPIKGECTIEVVEDDKSIFSAEKYIKFGESFFFRKKHNANEIYINVSSEDSNIAVIYTYTTIFHS